MKTRHIYIILSAVALMFSACQSEDLPVQHPDGYDQLSFSVEAGEMTSRATDNNYDANKYPSTMGVWCSELNFANTKVWYADSKWNYENPIYWENYVSITDFNFFAYMPWLETGASLTPGTGEKSNEYTLSFPVTIANGITCTQTDCPLISRYPTHLVGIQQNVKLYMDQVLTAFRVQFELGTKMDNVRDVIIKSVTLKDATDATVSVFPVSGTVSRTYSYPASDKYNWTADDITWTDITKHTVTSTPYYINVEGTTEQQSSGLTLNSTSFQQWGDGFFTIPSTGFTPTIEVKYDVTLNDDGVTTRKEIVSNIVLNKTNFPNYDPTVAGTPGIIYPIQIKIVPSYLYVLADDDQTTGYIVIQ